jgi:hypothetical protein
MLGNERGGFAILNPIPPLGRIFLTHLFPVCLSSSGVSTGTGHVLGLSPQTSRCDEIPYDKIDSCNVVNTCVHINGTPFADCAHADSAQTIAKTILLLAKTAPEERAGRIQAWLRDMFDTKPVELQIKMFDERAAPLWLACNFQFIYVCVLVPLVIWHHGLSREFIPVLLGMFVIAAWIALIFWFLHAEFFPDARARRIKTILEIVPFPPGSIRAYQTLNKEFLSFAHPFVVAYILLSKVDFMEAAGRFFRDTLYPVGGHRLSTEDCHTEDWFRTEVLSAAGDFLKSVGISAESLLAPPVPSDDSVIAYCPRCLGQFTIQAQTCPDCPGICPHPFHVVCKNMNEASDA